MNPYRRQALLTTLFGAGCVGLRALATGLPVSFLLNPRKALASGAADGGTCTPVPGKAQYIIMSTSGGGDPINRNVPGTYEDANIKYHPTQANMAPAPLTMNGNTLQAAMPWTQLQTTSNFGGVNMANRTVFFHMATNTPIHPQEPEVLQLMGATQQHEMLPSLLAKATAPSLCTVQPQPVSIGASSPSEALQYGGSTLPIIPPSALRDTLLNPTGPLSSLQTIRDQTMNTIYGIYKNGATPPQQQYIDKLVTSQQQVRALNQQVLGQLATLSKDPVLAQITAAVTLIQLQVSPLISIHIPFGGDNHSDAGLATEAAQTVSGVGYIVSLLQALQSAKDAHGVSLQDQVMFMTLNVFGRTLINNGGNTCADGTAHNGNHHVAVCIGKPFNGGVIGGVAPVKNSLGNDYGATSISSSTGASNGDVQATDTLAAFGMTMLQAVGGDPTVITSQTGKPIAGALA
jgi:hypothetical protein